MFISMVLEHYLILGTICALINIAFPFENGNEEIPRLMSYFLLCSSFYQRQKGGKVFGLFKIAPSNLEQLKTHVRKVYMELT